MQYQKTQMVSWKPANVGGLGVRHKVVKLKSTQTVQDCFSTAGTATYAKIKTAEILESLL